MIVSSIVSATQIQTNDKQIHHSQTTRTPSQSMPDHPHAYDAYQELASAYAEKINTKPHNAYYERPAMLSMLPKIAGMHVLDAGCGPGVYAQELAARGAQVIACDVSDRMLEFAAERLRAELLEGNVRLAHIDLSQPLTMFEDESFDLINAPLCLDYVEDWRSLFTEFRRLLKPAGTVLFSCGHPAFDAEYFKTKTYFSVESVECTWNGFGKKVRMPSFRRSLEEIVAPVMEAGFIMERIHEPQPTSEFKLADPLRYRTLMRRPGFLCVRARK